MPLRSIKLAGATAVAGLTALTIAGAAADLRMRTAVAHLIEGRPGLTVAATSVGWFDGSLTLRGIAIDGERGRARVGAIRLARGGSLLDRLCTALVAPARAFPAAGAAGAAGAAAPGVATAENVSITYQGVTYTIPRIEIAGTTLSDSDLAAMLDVDGAETVEARLRRLDAASISLPDIKADTVDGDFEQHWDQQQVLFAGIKDGKAAAGSAGPGILKTKSAKGTSVAEVGGLQMTGVDMGQIVHVATIARQDEAEAQQVLAQSLVVSAIRLHDDGQGPSVTLATLKEAGLKARSLALISRARSLLLATGKPGDPAVDAFVQDIAGSISVDLLQADNLVVTPPKASTDGPARLARLTITEVHDRRIGDVTLQGLRYDQAADHLSLASAEAKDLIVPATLDGKSVPAFTSLDLTDLAVDIEVDGEPAKGQQAGADGQATREVPIEKRLTFELRHAAVSAPGARIGTLPPRSTAVVENLRLTIRPDMSPMLIALGYPKVDISSHITSSYDAASQALKIEDWTLNGVGMGRAVLKLQLGKVSDAILSANPDVQKTATAAMLFKGIDLTVADEGLVDRLLGYRATQDNITVAQERENAIDLVRNKLPVLAGDPAKLKPVEEAIARFIADPKLPLHIGATSADGLGAADAGLLNDPNALLDRLSIVATAGQ